MSSFTLLGLERLTSSSSIHLIISFNLLGKRRMITYWNSHYLLAIEKKKKNYKYSCHATLFVLDFWKCCKSKCHPLSLVVATGKHKDAVFCTESAFIMLFHSHYQSAFHWSLLPFYSFHMNISSVNINNHAPLIIHPRKKKYSYKKSHSPLSKS